VARMARTSTKERARSRTLPEIELRAFWRAADGAGVFGRYLQFTLLTATRRNESAHLRRAEIKGTEWTIPAHRYKSKIDHLVPMSDAAVAVLGKVPKVGKGDFVFTTADGKPIAGFGCRKATFDKLMLAGLRKIDPGAIEMQRWTLHDLRRTARSLMSRAGVSSDHAERCLGHVIGGVEGTYDRYEHAREKRQAFTKLADLADRIVNPESNVVSFAERTSVNSR
jgi:integrase